MEEALWIALNLEALDRSKEARDPSFGAPDGIYRGRAQEAEGETCKVGRKVGKGGCR